MRTPTCHAFCAALVLTLSACVSVPENMAVTQDFNVMGLTYRAKLLWVAPIFVNAFGESAYRDAGGQTGGLIADMIVGTAMRGAQISQIATSAGTAITGEFEERYRGSFCHYFLETDDPELVRVLNTTGEDEDEEENEDFQRQSLDYHATNLDGLAASTTDPFLLSEIARLQREIEAVRQELTPSDAPMPPRMVSVVNPCRDFRPGETLVVSRLDYKVVLERAPGG